MRIIRPPRGAAGDVGGGQLDGGLGDHLDAIRRELFHNSSYYCKPHDNHKDMRGVSNYGAQGTNDYEDPELKHDLMFLKVNGAKNVTPPSRFCSCSMFIQCSNAEV